MTHSVEGRVSHALDGHAELVAAAQASAFWIDGTAEDGTYQGDATSGPWVVFDITAQENVAGPYESAKKVRAALAIVLKHRGEK